MDTIGMFAVHAPMSAAAGGGGGGGDIDELEPRPLSQAATTAPDAACRGIGPCSITLGRGKFGVPPDDMLYVPLYCFNA